MFTRWVYFFLAILAGIGIGLLFGWVILPAQYTDTTPDTLRVDFRTDYVLMVAESYSRDGDLPEAMRRLVFLEEALPDEIIRQAILFAEPRYSDADLEMMRQLYEDVRAVITGQPGGSP
jgi:hypothetical protein